ncbi:MAG: hypothetical protein H0T49_01025 [Chloroflexia bacterium]|nr:hypothetical protein [Chloroflexia bacterium]
MLKQLLESVPRSDILRLVVSILLALLLWGWVTSVENPDQTRVFAGVPVEVDPLPDALQVVTNIQDVEVRIQGPRSVVSEINMDDIVARLELSDIDSPGSYNALVEVDVPANVHGVRANPGVVPIIIQATIVKETEITIQRPDLEDGSRQVGDISPTVSRVTISGPSSVVERVDRVVLSVEIGDQNDDFWETFALVAQDRSGAPVPEILLDPATVATFVNVSARGKSVAVIADIEGNPAPGYGVSDRTVNPPTVVVDGPAEALTDLVFLTTEPVDITGATETVSQRIGLGQLPVNVTVLGLPSEQVDVVVAIQRLGISQPLPEQEILVTGLASNLSADFSPRSADVMIFGAEEVLAQIQSGDIDVILDLTDLGPGAYQRPLEVSVPRGVQWEGTDPMLVEVTITANATSSPNAAR